MPINEGWLWLASALGLIAIIFLAAFIRRQLRRMSDAQKRADTQKQAAEAKRADIIESIQVIASCLLDKQVEPTEACIRIKVLLDFVSPELHQQAPYSTFNLIYEKTRHMPTHSAWKALDKRERRHLEKERYALEAEYEKDIQKAMHAILTYPFRPH